MWRAVFFPEMGVRIDGEPLSISVDETTGLVVHSQISGRHRVEWFWAPFPALRRARRLTIFALGVAIALFLVGLSLQDRHRRVSP